MEEAKQRLKVYCETTFWSYLNGGRTPLEHNHNAGRIYGKVRNSYERA